MTKCHVATYSRFKTAYGPNLASKGIDFAGAVSLTQQHDKEACDINNIMDQYGRTGLLPQGANPPVFGNFSDGNDYQEKLNCVLTAQESFMALPASVRSRFGNDPTHLLDFLSDDGNRAEAIKLGLVSDNKSDLTEAVKADVVAKTDE